jgi:hypothetical protein
MAMHVEWDTATNCEISLCTAAEAEENLGPDTPLTAEYVLCLGGGGGGGLGVEGSRDELIAFTDRLRAELGVPVPTSSPELSEEAKATIAGAIAMSSDGINVDGIYGDWIAARAAFPMELFWAWAKATGHPDGNDGTGYDPEAGE